MAVRRKFDLRFKETVLQYAEETSGEQAARFFNIDSKRIRYWRKQRAELRSADQGRARLSGGGRKKLSVELERRLSEWIHAMRDKREPVSADMIKNKALEIYPTVSDGGSRFVASTGWLQKFLKRYNLSLRRRSAVTHEDPNLLVQKLVWFVDYVGKTVSAKRILEKDIITMDETVVWFDTASPTGAAKGQERSQLTVVLAAKADGTKLKPFIVFKGAEGEAEVMRRQISGAVINTSANGWMSDALTADWLESVVEKSNATPRLLVWDSQRSHVSVTAKLKHDFNITPAVIPRGCTEYVQAHNVVWNQPFKQSLHEAYNRWMAGDDHKEYTAEGDLKPPARGLLVDWVVAAWDKLDADMIRESFKVCGLSVKSDGSEDDRIACFKEGQPCAAGRDALSQARQRSWENWSPAAEEEEDGVEVFYFEEEEDEEELVFDEVGDEEEDVFQEEDDGDHTPFHCFIHQALPSDVQNVITVKEEQQEWSSSVDQEDPEPPHIKEEEEGEQLHRLKEADITTFPFTVVPVKSEDDEEKPPTSQLHQTEADGQDCGGPESTRISDIRPETEDGTGESCEAETDDSDDWTESREAQSGLKSPVGDSSCGAGEKLFSCSECGNRFGRKDNLQQHMKTHTGEKPFSCPECGKRFGMKGKLKIHMRTHTGEKPFSCSVCKKCFTQRGNLQTHMKNHSGEKPFSCSVCDKKYVCKADLMRHMKTHTGEKPFVCSVCAKTYTERTNLMQHMSIHTGEKRHRCSFCHQRFIWYNQLQRHKCAGPWSPQRHQTQTEEDKGAEPPASRSEDDGQDCGAPEPTRITDPDLQPEIEGGTGDSCEAETDDSDDWTESREAQSGLKSPVGDSSCGAGEKLFSCSECGNRFGRQVDLKIHRRCSHPREKPFSCSVCQKSFTEKWHLQRHERIHSGDKRYSCCVCLQKFTWRRELKKHQCEGPRPARSRVLLPRPPTDQPVLFVYL